MPHPVDVHVGKRVKQLRWLKGMTQQQLAKKVGVKFQQVQKYETGANRVSASRLWQLCEALEVPVSFFFEGIATGGKKGSTPGLEGNDLLNERDALELVRAYYSMHSDLRRYFLDLAKAIPRYGDAPVLPTKRPKGSKALPKSKK